MKYVNWTSHVRTYNLVGTFWEQCALWTIGAWRVRALCVCFVHIPMAFAKQQGMYACVNVISISWERSILRRVKFVYSRRTECSTHARHHYPTTICVAQNDHVPVPSLYTTRTQVKGDLSWHEFVCCALTSVHLGLVVVSFDTNKNKSISFESARNRKI